MEISEKMLKDAYEDYVRAAKHLTSCFEEFDRRFVKGKQVEQVNIKAIRDLESTIGKILDTYETDEQLISVRKICVNLRNVATKGKEQRNKSSLNSVVFKQSVAAVENMDPFKKSSDENNNKDKNENKNKIKTEKVLNPAKKNRSDFRGGNNQVKLTVQSLNMLSFDDVIRKLRQIISTNSVDLTEQQELLKIRNTLTVLKFLKETKVNQVLLKRTEAGKLLSSIQKTAPKPEVRNFCKTVIERWKKVLESRSSKQKNPGKNISKSAIKPTNKFSRIKTGEYSRQLKGSSSSSHEATRSRSSTTYQTPIKPRKRQRESTWEEEFARKLRNGYDRAQSEERYSRKIGKLEDDAADVG